LAWWALATMAAVALVAGIVTWPIWQNESRDLVELPHASFVTVLPMVLTAVVVFLVLLLIGRLIGFAAVRLDRFIGRFVPVWAARAVTLLIVVGLGVALVAGGGEAFVSWANGSFGAAATGTEDGVAPTHCEHGLRQHRIGRGLGHPRSPGKDLRRTGNITAGTGGLRRVWHRGDGTDQGLCRDQVRR
jgi:hypothetical protein